MNRSAFPVLSRIEDIPAISFFAPVKKINSGDDLSHFLRSKAYHDIMTFLLQLNRSMFPISTSSTSDSPTIQTWEINSPNITFSESITNLRTLLSSLQSLIDSAPPDPGPRRFGNISFRRWFEIVSDRTPELLRQHLPNLPPESHEEITPYLLGSFGSAQRLDYGSGHELSFLAFLGSLWKLSFFHPPDSEPPQSSSPDTLSRAIVTGILQPYLHLIRTLISTYTLEPAGSHGVWGLDDHSFLPYIFGSAQLGPPIPTSSPDSPTPTEGSLPRAPDQSDVVTPAKTDRWKDTNLYFSAIAFIHDVKKGPFWEHSPMLYDISGVRGGWAKINKGMLKMYVAEVLGKFPVVQHFPFGSLFSWELDPDGGGTEDVQGEQKARRNVHVASQPVAQGSGLVGAGTKAPWAATTIPGGQASVDRVGGTRAPWAGNTARPPPVEGTKAPWATAGQSTLRGPPAMKTSERERMLKSGPPRSGEGNDVNRMGPPASFSTTSEDQKQ